MAHYSTHRLLRPRSGALFGLTLCVACASHPPSTPKDQIQLQKQVAKVEPNKESRKAIDRTLHEIQGEVSRWQAVRSELSKDVFATLARHDASAADFQALEARTDAISAASRKALLDLRFSLRDQLSDTQWKGLFGSKNP